MSDEPNPREAIGGNAPPDWAKIETDRLNEEYAGFKRTLQELAAEAENFPEQIDDDPAALNAGALIKRFRDLRERMENERVTGVEPHLRRQNAINAFWKGLKTIIQPEDKSERRTRPGWIDRLQARIDDYQNRKEAAERARLEQIRLEQERIAREARERAEKEAAALAAKEKAEREAKEAAERARNPERIEEKTAVAEQASQATAEQAASTVEAEIVAERAQEEATAARIATLAKPADIVRTRGVSSEGAGVTLTTAKESYAFVTDRRKLDPVKLFPHFTDAEVEKAVRAFAKATHHDEPMEGAEIGWKRKGITR